MEKPLIGKAARIEFAERYKYGEKEESISFGFVEGGEVEFSQSSYMNYDWICKEFRGVFVPKKDSENIGLFIGDWDLFLVDVENQKVTEIRGEINPDDFPGCEKWFDIREEAVLFGD